MHTLLVPYGSCSIRRRSTVGRGLWCRCRMRWMAIDFTWFWMADGRSRIQIICLRRDTCRHIVQLTFFTTVTGALNDISLDDTLGCFSHFDKGLGLGLGCGQQAFAAYWEGGVSLLYPGTSEVGLFCSSNSARLTTPGELSSTWEMFLISIYLPCKHATGWRQLSVWKVRYQITTQNI